METTYRGASRSIFIWTMRSVPPASTRASGPYRSSNPTASSTEVGSR
jgi:hypothetical protein